MAKVDPDAPLVQAAQGGDMAAFEALVDQHEKRVYSNAFRILRHPQDAEDVTQQTFASAIKHLADFRGEASFQTWLLRISTHSALKILRKRHALPLTSLEAETEPGDLSDAIPHPEFIADWRDSPEVLAGRRETQELLDRALAELDEKHRLVFLLRDVQQLSIKQTAEALGLTEANTKVRLLRARLQLRELLTGVLGDPARQRQPHKHEVADV
jgi:RNA polymerase sigma-70 factor (ECF subfamily)